MLLRVTLLILLVLGMGSQADAQLRLWPICLSLDTLRQEAQGVKASEILPVLRGDIPWAAALDAQLKERARRVLAAFIEQNKDPESLDPDIPMEQEGEWTLEWATPRLLSLMHTSFAYTGGAHPMHESEALILSWDGKELRTVSLDRLLKWSPSLEKTLRTQTSAQLRLLGAYEAVQKGWKGLSTARLKQALPTRDGLLYTFDPYEVGSYADGTFRFTVPWRALGDELPAGEFLKQELWK